MTNDNSPAGFVPLQTLLDEAAVALVNGLAAHGVRSVIVSAMAGVDAGAVIVTGCGTLNAEWTRLHSMALRAALEHGSFAEPAKPATEGRMN
jgi:hypothetical protein